jgi:hypothetical protein
METIKNTHKFTDILSAAEIEKLEDCATQHLRFSNITFKVIKVVEDEIHVRAEQGEHLSENYADDKTLITRTRELFGPSFPGKTIYVHPVPYTQAIVDVVTPEWISERILQNLQIQPKINVTCKT